MSAIPQDVQQWLATEWNAQAFTDGLWEISIVAANVLGQPPTQQYV